MLFLSIIIYTLFGLMCLWFIISGVRKLQQVRNSQSLSEFYTNEEEHDQAIKDAEQYETGYFERIKQGEQSQQFLAVGSFAICSLLRSLLAAENIPTYTQNEHINTMYSLNVLGGSSSFSIKVYILISDYERASEIIHDFISAHKAPDQDSRDYDKESDAVNKIAIGTFFLCGVPVGTTQDTVYGITVFPRVEG